MDSDLSESAPGDLQRGDMQQRLDEAWQQVKRMLKPLEDTGFDPQKLGTSDEEFDQQWINLAKGEHGAREMLNKLRSALYVYSGLLFQQDRESAEYASTRRQIDGIDKLIGRPAPNPNEK